MDSSLFYLNFQPNDEDQKNFINMIKESTLDEVNPVYVIRRPIIEKKTEYEYENAFAVLVPKHKIMFFDFGNNPEEFEEYVEDFIEDIGYIAKKFEFIKLIGRARQWRDDFTVQMNKEELNGKNIKSIWKECELVDVEMVRKGEILISLTLGSINEAERLGVGVPDNILDLIKRKIILFDGEQTKFIFDEPAKRRITIQGLAGTGKTELLLHKIKELYGRWWAASPGSLWNG